MYKRFIRWASDRLADYGIIGFVSNNGFLDAGDDSYNAVIKWSRNLRRHFESGQRIEFAKDKVIAAHYRPYVLKWYFADPI